LGSRQATSSRGRSRGQGRRTRGHMVGSGRKEGRCGNPHWWPVRNWGRTMHAPGCFRCAFIAEHYPNLVQRQYTRRPSANIRVHQCGQVLHSTGQPMRSLLPPARSYWTWHSDHGCPTSLTL